MKHRGAQQPTTPSHRLIVGDSCERCLSLATTVAIYQDPPSKGEPYGSLRYVPLCNTCALVALGSSPRPRLVEHDEELRRQAQRRADERARSLQQLEKDSPRLGDW